jgi:hypothetical protein
MTFLNSIRKLFTANPKNPLDGKTYLEKVDFLIKSITEFQNKQIYNLKYEASSNFYHEKIDEIKILVQNLEFERIEDMFLTTPKTFDDLAYFSFTDESQKKYVAIIYDSDELWLDPEVFDIIAINDLNQ